MLDAICEIDSCPLMDLLATRANEASIMYVSSPGSQGLGTRCFSTPLELSYSLRVYPLCSSKTSLVKSDAFEKSLLGPGSSSLASKGVAHRSVGFSGGRIS